MSRHKANYMIIKISSLHWSTIGTSLVLALAASWLVLMQEWEPWNALLAVAAVAAGCILCLLGVLVLAAGQDRAEIWRLFKKAIKDDWERLK